jgi:kynurenine formamidase
LLLLLGVASGRAQGPTGTAIDLSYPFNEETVYWPTASPFELTVEAAGQTDGGYWYAANSFRAAEHGGTHLDAPIHFAEGKRTAAEIPLDDLMGPAVVIDVSPAAADDPDYLVDLSAMEAWEAQHGAIPDRTIVLLMTGWGAGLDPDVAAWLVGERRVRAVGIDTASIDRGQSTEFHAHRVLAEANVPIFENVANLDRLPSTGAWVVALPMQIERGTGGPLRAVAFVSDSGQ